MDLDFEDFDGFADPDRPQERPRLHRPGYWLTKDRMWIKFEDMDNRHLLNTIALVERQFRALQDQFDTTGLDISEICPEHFGLVKEAISRNLLPKNTPKHQCVTR